jgi:hypothetical protein
MARILTCKSDMTARHWQLTCHKYSIRVRSQTSSRPDAYQANTLSKGRRVGIEDAHTLIGPLGPSNIATSGLI